MKIYLAVLFILSLIVQPLVAGEYAQQANDNPFLKGELNPKYEGELAVLAGEVIEIKSTKQNFPIYKLNLRIEGIKHIWVTSIAPQPEGGIKVGDMLIFKGFISTALATDPSGELGKIIGSRTLLMAVQSQRAN